MPFDIRPRIRRAFQLALRRRDLSDQEIDEELRTHFALRVARLEAGGLTRSDAEREALARLGGSWEETSARLREAGRARDGRLHLRERLDSIATDLAYAVRTLVRQPAFAIVVILTFALGIGANATMFGVIDRLLLRPPPHVRDPAEVLEVARVRQGDGGVAYNTAMQYPLYVQLRADSAAFREVAALSYTTTQSLGTGPNAEEAQAAFASANYFRVLGIQPALGRLFGPADEGELPTNGVAVLSYGFWQRHFAGERSILGKAIRIGPRDFTVVGVAPQDFTGVDPRRIDLWLPLSEAQSFGMAGAGWTSNWGMIWLRVHVRLQPGVAVRAAAARAEAHYKNGMAEWSSARQRKAPASLQDTLFALRSILPASQLADDPKAKLARLLLGVTVVVLLIACANVASLLLARGMERRREIAVRLALGVSRARLLRLLFAETVVLAVCGGAIAVVVAHWGIALLQATLLQEFTWTESAFDGRVVAMTLACVIMTVGLAGIAPAMRASRPDVVESLKAGGREGGVGVSRLRTVLMTAQMTLVVVLIVGAGLFVQSLRRAASVNLGYRPSGALAAWMELIPLGYKPPARLALYRAMRDRVAALPGVAEATVATTFPMRGYAYGIRIRVPGRDSLPIASNELITHNAVGPGFFSTLGIRILDGRPIVATDVDGNVRVTVVSNALARALWPGERAVDRCIVLNADSVCTTIVGVAADAKEALEGVDPRFMLYLPSGPSWPAGPNVLLVRARDGDATRLVEPVRRAMQGVASNLPYAAVQTFDDVLAPEVRPWRTGATLFSLFGALALAIAAMGLYSAISYSVVQRRHEFGVRLALGARIRDVVQLVMNQGIRAAVVGVALGSAAAIALGGVIAPLLFQTSPKSPSAFAVAGVVIVVVAGLASFVPAWRASRVDPVAALRGD